MTTFVNLESAASIQSKLNAVLGACEFFLDPATLLADTTMTYDLGQLRSVSDGTMIFTIIGQHSYRVVASNAAVYDLETAGGIRLLVIANGNGWYEFDAMAPFKDGTGDNLAKLQTLLTNKSTILGSNTPGVSISFSGGRYAFSGTINLKSRVRLYGHNSGFGAEIGTNLIFPAATAGIVVNRHNTLGPDTVTSTTGADGSELIGLRLIGGRGDVFNETHSGIWLRARAKIHNCSFSNWAGHGIYAAAGSDGNPYLGNCNLFRIDQVWVQFCRGSAVHIEGTDANAGTCFHVDGKNNDGWCVYEDSFLGNLHFGHHSESNYSGSYFSDNGSAFSGCYAEDGAGGNQSISGIQFGNMISLPNSGVGPKLSTEAANGPKALRNENGGFRGYHVNGSTDIAAEGNSVLAARHNVTGISYPFRMLWENDGSGVFVRWASSSTVLMRFNGASNTNTYGRSTAPGEALVITGFWLGLNANARYRSTGAGAPTTGTWARGDIIENTNISSGAPIMWGCSVAGSPGTWIAGPTWP